ncbi:MAG TPA: ribonucleotide-diphosphate reductase subunit beta [Ktedonobacterales bacterium]
MAHDTAERESASLALEQEIDRPSGGAIDYTRLYRLWEDNNWSAYDIDLTRDMTDWRKKLSAKQRAAARWNYALFLHGEEAVARTLAPFVGALWTQEQRVFVTTQIVDEARHHVFFSRFMREVLGDGRDMATTLDAVDSELTTGFRQVFAELDSVTDRLRQRPQDRLLLARSVLLYHLIVEGTMAHPSQHFIRAYLARRGLLPGFSEGIARISRDESRHMAFGIQVLTELVAEAPDLRHDLVRTLNKVLPWVIGVFVPPNLDQDYARCFGFEMADIYAFGLRSLQSKLTRVGIDPGTVRSLVQVGGGLSPDEQARRALTLLYAGVLGDAAPLRLDESVMDLLFDGLERVVNMSSHLDLPGPIQWSFPDAAPWYLVAHDGRGTVHRGQALAPALTISCQAEDWARIAGQKLNARLAVLRGRLRIKGDMRLAMRLPSLLGD